MLAVIRKLSGPSIGLNMDSMVNIILMVLSKHILSLIGLEQLLSKTAGKYCVGDEVCIICLSYICSCTCTTGHNG